MWPLKSWYILLWNFYDAFLSFSSFSSHSVTVHYIENSGQDRPWKKAWELVNNDRIFLFWWTMLLRSKTEHFCFNSSNSKTFVFRILFKIFLPKGAFTLHFKYAKNIYFCVTFTSSIDKTSLWIHRSPNFDKQKKTNLLHICMRSRSPTFACIWIKANGKQSWVWWHLTTGNDSIWWPSILHSVESAHVFSVLQYCMSIFPLCKFNSNKHKPHHTLTWNWNCF